MGTIAVAGAGVPEREPEGVAFAEGADGAGRPGSVLLETRRSVPEASVSLPEPGLRREEAAFAGGGVG